MAVTKGHLAQGGVLKTTTSSLVLTKIAAAFCDVIFVFLWMLLELELDEHHVILDPQRQGERVPPR